MYKRQDSSSELELSFFLADNSSIVDFELDIIDNTNSNYENVELIWGRDSFRNSKSIDYENRYTALSYGFENNKDSYLSVAGTTNKVIDNVNWVSFREHFFSSILILNNESNQVEISSEDLSGNDALDKKFTKRFLANIPLSLDSNNQLSFSMYFGPTDYETLKDYNLIACEFNVIPLNLVSKQFHESLDYENVGFQLTENGTKKVSLIPKFCLKPNCKHDQIFAGINYWFECAYSIFLSKNHLR